MADRRAQIEARLSAATPGPWRVGYWSPDEPEVNAILAEEQTFVVCADEDPIKPADANLIAHAPDDLRWLLDALAEAEAERDALAALVREAALETYTPDGSEGFDAGYQAARAVGPNGPRCPPTRTEPRRHP